MEKHKPSDEDLTNSSSPVAKEIWLEFENQPGTTPLSIGVTQQKLGRRTVGAAIHGMRATDDPDSPIVIAA